ncbi:MAG: hypothetical protein HY900_19635 [Deltaproteobacteria bacterium]|nr:hypothetical protein [Deltaproteobacteria bacterium]
MQVNWKDRPECPSAFFDFLLSEGSHAFFRTEEAEGSYLAWTSLGEAERAALLKAKHDLEESIGRAAAELKAALAGRLGPVR